MNAVSHKISKEIFRAYDIRGIVEKTLTIDAVFSIGRAIGTTVLSKGERTIIVARDGRLSGPSLMEALTQGILETGCDVIDIGMVPTPVLYFATHYLQTPSGVMITGSHNPPDYNGLKILIGGDTLYGEGIQNLFRMIQAENFKVGKGKKYEKGVAKAYIETITHDIQLKSPLKIVVDCGNGVAGELAPQLYQALNCEVIPLFCEIDGRFPNHHPDPGQPQNLVDIIKAVKEHKADLGLAFDGDGDRLGVIDNEGNIIWPDRQLILFAKDILSRSSRAHIIFDVKCTRHVATEVKAAGGIPLMWKTGHSLIKAKMKETGALLAGEMSGHLFFKERWYGFDDGLYAGARLLEILAKKHKQQTAREVFQTLPDSLNTPELMLAVTEDRKFSDVEKLIALAHFEDAKVSIIDGLRVDFKDGFGLVRPSNTGPNLILRFEGDSKEALSRIQNEFRYLMLQVEPSWQLPF